MDLRVKLANIGAVDKAIERVKAAKEELLEAACALDKACGNARVEIEEAVNAIADGKMTGFQSARKYQETRKSAHDKTHEKGAIMENNQKPNLFILDEKLQNATTSEAGQFAVEILRFVIEGNPSVHVAERALSIASGFFFRAITSKMNVQDFLGEDIELSVKNFKLEQDSTL